MIEPICEYDLFVHGQKGIASIYNLATRSILMTTIIERQQGDATCKFMRQQIINGNELEGWTLNEDKCLSYRGRLFVPKDSTS